MPGSIPDTDRSMFRHFGFSFQTQLAVVRELFQRDQTNSRLYDACCIVLLVHRTGLIFLHFYYLANMAYCILRSIICVIFRNVVTRIREDSVGGVDGEMDECELLAIVLDCALSLHQVTTISQQHRSTFIPS